MTARSAKVLATFEATLLFIKETHTGTYNWVNCDDMKKSKEIICITPKTVRTVRKIPRIPLGEKETEYYSPVRRILRMLSGVKETPPPVGT